MISSYRSARAEERGDLDSNTMDTVLNEFLCVLFLKYMFLYFLYEFGILSRDFNQSLKIIFSSFNAEKVHKGSWAISMEVFWVLRCFVLGSNYFIHISVTEQESLAVM